jgi:hypothetical protein
MIIEALEWDKVTYEIQKKFETDSLKREARLFLDNKNKMNMIWRK